MIFYTPAWFVPFQQQVLARLASIEAKINLLTKYEVVEMASLDDLQAKVAAQKTVADSAVTLLKELKTELDAAIASGDMSKVQAISDAIDANSAELAQAVTDNTPAAPPPAPAPPVVPNP